MLVLVRLPWWAFDVCLYLCQTRARYFQNQFPNKKLRALHARFDYVEYIEGIIGYYGDIACAMFLGIDPRLVLATMVRDTKGMTQRDNFDLIYNGNNLDVKIEDFSYNHDSVINGNIRYDQAYGCRLINQTQWNQNSTSIDYYVFGSFQYPFSDNFKLHEAKSIFLLGYVPKVDLIDVPVSHVSPANLRLLTPAKIIPNDQLYPILNLPYINKGRRVVPNYPQDDARTTEILANLNRMWTN